MKNDSIEYESDSYLAVESDSYLAVNVLRIWHKIDVIERSMKAASAPGWGTFSTGTMLLLTRNVQCT